MMEPDVSAAMAKRVAELRQLAESIAEHHPYWPTLHFTLELLARLVENWHKDFDKEELEELIWLAEKILDEVKRLAR